MRIIFYYYYNIIIFQIINQTFFNTKIIKTAQHLSSAAVAGPAADNWNFYYVFYLIWNTILFFSILFNCYKQIL